MNTNGDGTWRTAPAPATWPPRAAGAPSQRDAATMGVTRWDAETARRDGIRERDATARADRARHLEEERRTSLAHLEDHDARTVRRERVTAAMSGAFVFFVSIAAFPAPSTQLMASVSAIGVLVGILAHALGDHAWVWALSSFGGAALIAPMVSGPLYALLVLVLAVGSWTAGHFRDPR